MSDTENYLTVVATVFTSIEAHMLVALLADAEIEAVVENEASVSWYPGAAYAFGGIRVLVRSSEAERALAILDSSASNLDESAI